jgi:hypothetical protein
MFTIVVHLPSGWASFGNFFNRETANEAMIGVWMYGNYAGREMHVKPLAL